MSKGVGGFLGMALIGVVLCAMLVGGAWLLVDGTNADYIAPMPTPFHDDRTSDVLTISEPEPDEITPELAEVAVIDEITDLARDTSDNQLQQAQDATGAVASVAIAGYAANTAIVGSFTFRDLALAALAVAGLFLYWQIKRASKERQ